MSGLAARLGDRDPDTAERGALDDADLRELARVRMLDPADACPHSRRPAITRAGCSLCLGAIAERVIARVAPIPDDAPEGRLGGASDRAAAASDGWSRSARARPRDPVALPEGREHGTSWAYTMARCSCDACRAWNVAPRHQRHRPTRAEISEARRRAGRAGKAARKHATAPLERPD